MIGLPGCYDGTRERQVNYGCICEADYTLKIFFANIFIYLPPHKVVFQARISNNCCTVSFEETKC